MKFIAKKCYIITTEKGGVPFFYTLNDHILQYVGTNPYLSVTLSEDLTFDAHVENIIKKGSRMLGFIQRNLKGSPSRLKELEYLTDLAWNMHLLSGTRSCRRKLIASKRSSAGRHALSLIITGRDVDSTQLIDSLGWDSLQERHKIARLYMLYKAINREVALSIDAV